MGGRLQPGYAHLTVQRQDGASPVWVPEEIHN